MYTVLFSNNESDPWKKITCEVPKKKCNDYNTLIDLKRKNGQN